MLTIGVDLAAQPGGTAVCWIKWSAGTARAYRIQQPVEDDELLGCFQAADADKVGVDVPFGWPDEFVDALLAYRSSTAWPRGNPKLLLFRETDRVVQKMSGRWPLSVSSDRIAVTAMRAARLFSRLAQPVERDGSGRLVEVYPAGGLRCWGFSEGRDNRLAEVDRRTRPWLHLEEPVRRACEASDDALDALIAALVARAAGRGLCEPIPEEVRERARREGWIALPRPDSLDGLASEDLSQKPGKGAAF